MKRAFEQFAAWQLAPPSKPRRYIPRAGLDAEAWQRWDGEGGYVGMPEPRSRRERARQLARMRSLGRMRASAPTPAPWPSTLGGYAKQAP